MSTQVSNSYVDFLGVSALAYSAEFNKPYTADVCVYALNIAHDYTYTAQLNRNVLQSISGWRIKDINWNNIIDNMKFAKSNSADYMCYRFKMPNITTESDDEPDDPYSYEELFNESVINHISASTAMQYGYIYDAYLNTDDDYQHPIKTENGWYSVQHIVKNNFYVTNNIASTKDFVRSDYYKLFVPETNVVHNRSLLEMNDTSASVGNQSHESFNALLFCINPNFDSAITSTDAYSLPNGFTGVDFPAIPISLCTYSKDITLAGNNTVFEPNLNGIVTVE